MTTEARRREIIDCLHNWKVSYQVTGNQTVIDKSIRELVGEEKLMWFDYSQTDEFVNNEECYQLGFDAKKELINLLNIKNIQSDTWDSIRKRIFNKIAGVSFFHKLNEIIGETASSDKRNKLIEFIKQCEDCYSVSINDSFVQLAREAKKVDIQLNDWIQSRAYDEIGVINNPTTGEISDNFIKLIAEPKIERVTPPQSYVIEQSDDVNTHWLKTLYSKYGWQTQVCIFCALSFIYWLIFGWDSFLLLELILATLLANFLLAIWFKFFYREKSG